MALEGKKIVSSVGSFFSYVNDARSHDPEVKIYVVSMF